MQKADPIDLRLSAGQAHDSRTADDMLDIMRADTNHPCG